MDEETFNAAIEGTERQYDVNCRQVSNGFALAGNIRYIVPATKYVKVAQAHEAVAHDPTQAGDMLAKFLLSGTFE